MGRPWGEIRRGDPIRAEDANATGNLARENARRLGGQPTTAGQGRMPGARQRLRVELTERLRHNSAADAKVWRFDPAFDWSGLADSDRDPYDGAADNDVYADTTETLRVFSFLVPTGKQLPSGARGFAVELEGEWELVTADECLEDDPDYEE